MANGIICRSYDELIDAIAARVVEINTTHLALDAKTGLASGHSGKLLAVRRTKGYGKLSLDLHLQALGLAIVVIPDPARPVLVAEQRKIYRRDPEDVLATRRRARAQQDMPEPPAPAP
jgi:hypothetical protein